MVFIVWRNCGHVELKGRYWSAVGRFRLPQVQKCGIDFNWTVPATISEHSQTTVQSIEPRTSMLRLLSTFSNPRIRLNLQAQQVTFARSSSTIAQLLSDTASTPGSSPRHLTVNGFVRSVRKQKRVAFAAISDGSSYEALQAVLTPDQAKEYVQQACIHA